MSENYSDAIFNGVDQRRANRPVTVDDLNALEIKLEKSINYKLDHSLSQRLEAAIGTKLSAMEDRFNDCTKRLNARVEEAQQQAETLTKKVDDIGVNQLLLIELIRSKMDGGIFASIKPVHWVMIGFGILIGMVALVTGDYSIITKIKGTV